MKHCVVAAFCILGVPVEAFAGDVFEEMFAPYRQRIDGVTAGAGNAKAINSATHIIDPWPPYAANRRIPANGERMVGAMERYRDVKKIEETPATLQPDATSTTEITVRASSSQ